MIPSIFSHISLKIARSSLHTEEVANTERDKTQVSNEEQGT